LRFTLWGLALLLSLLLPIYVNSSGKKDAAAQAEIDIITAQLDDQHYRLAGYVKWDCSVVGAAVLIMIEHSGEHISTEVRWEPGWGY